MGQPTRFSLARSIILFRFATRKALKLILRKAPGVIRHSIPMVHSTFALPGQRAGNRWLLTPPVADKLSATIRGNVAPLNSLLLVDDHPLFRSGFAGLAALAWPAVALLVAGDGDTALEVLAGNPGVLAAIIDIQLPGRDGFDTAMAIASRHPAVARILISGREDQAARQRARNCGAAAFIAKSSPGATIIATIETVLAGGDGFAHDAEETAMPLLSPRQIEVLALLATGASNLQICNAMGIADRTVRAHLTQIFDLLGVNSRVQAILQAQRLGLIR